MYHPGSHIREPEDRKKSPSINPTARLGTSCSQKNVLDFKIFPSEWEGNWVIFCVYSRYLEYQEKEKEKAKWKKNLK
jgi:hypothetical protein